MRGLRGITKAYIVGKLFIQSELIYKHIHRTVKIGGLVVHKLKHSLVAKRGKAAVKRHTRQQIVTEFFRDLINVAVTENINMLSAVGADRIAHIFNKTKHRNIHHLCHVSRFRHDHGDQLLRA